MVDDALAWAEVAWTPGAPLSENIAATLLAKELGFFHRINATPHGAEPLELHADMTAAHVGKLDAGFAALLARRDHEVART